MPAPQDPAARPHAGEAQGYDSSDIRRLVDLPASVVRALTRAGHVQPRKVDGRLRFSFQDLIVLRTASALRAANISTARLNRTLLKLRTLLPEGMPLSGVSLTALGDQVAVRQGSAVVESDTGQYALGLEFTAPSGDLHAINANAPEPARLNEQFEAALALEQDNAAAAIAAYQACLAMDAQHTEARINLGRLLHEQGQLVDAERIYRATHAKDPILAFNLAVVLEDLGHEDAAVASYREALALDPGLGDAHYNLARLYERAGQERDSLRHLLAYRRFVDKQGG